MTVKNIKNMLNPKNIKWQIHIAKCLMNHRLPDDITVRNKFIEKNYNKNKRNHRRLINILKEVTVGEIFYGFTDGGYCNYAEDWDVWNENMFEGWRKGITDKYVEQDMLKTGYDFYYEWDSDENTEISICVLLANPLGDYSTFSKYDNCILPLLKLNKDGTETFYERNLTMLENRIRKMKNENQWETRKHWYNSLYVV